MWLTVKEASEHYKIKKSTLYHWVASGTIPHYKIGQLVRFKKDEIDEWLKKFKKKKGSTAKKSSKYTGNSKGYDIDNLIRKAIDESRDIKV